MKSSVRGLYRPDLTRGWIVDAQIITRRFSTGDFPFITAAVSEDYLRFMIQDGMLVGAFYDESLPDLSGSIVREVSECFMIAPKFQRRHIAMTLENVCSKLYARTGKIPFAQIITDNENPRDCRKKRDFACRVTKFSGCAKNDEKGLDFSE